MKRLFLILSVLTFVLTSVRAIDCTSGNCKVCVPTCLRHSESHNPNYPFLVQCGPEIYGYAYTMGNSMCQLFYNRNGDTSSSANEISTYVVDWNYCQAWVAMMASFIENQPSYDCSDTSVSWITTGSCSTGYEQLSCNFDSGNNNLGTWSRNCSSSMPVGGEPKMPGNCTDPYPMDYITSETASSMPSNGCFICGGRPVFFGCDGNGQLMCSKDAINNNLGGSGPCTNDGWNAMNCIEAATNISYCYY